MKPVNVVLVGIGGYGGFYVNALLQGGGKYPYILNGVVDPYPERSHYYEKIRELKIPMYPSLEAYYAVAKSDLAVIASPIQYHSTQTCLALSQGSNVLSEKPLCPTMEEAFMMMKARDQAQKFVAIGYQWSHSQGIQDLKRDIMSGEFGKPLRLKTLVLWPRTDSYYARGWAGKKQDANGTMILDSVANNATAHYLHNMFYVLGEGIAESAFPSVVRAELYRANFIDNFDTAAMRAYTENGVEVLYYGSHAVNQSKGALFRYEFEQAVITFDDGEHKKGSPIVARFHNGEIKEYENPNQHPATKLWMAIAAVAEQGVPVCGIEAAMSQTMCISGMQASMREIVDFPEAIVKRGERFWKNDTGHYVEGLVEQMTHCYEQAILPAEAGYHWAKSGESIQLSR
ncbi:Gfo/Idh/MocA family oxidoreductase [Paenibacillus qinlingensis]|uniref:Dehydrogenase n=1 Tax=Paenibacillus qinlingensis TaxID=1837343 RepID=A0ABU1NRK6_9BACL|nr:Gfo/Idh/MocA family oxidoreductase [Paenibacillus qinlingensis]MDR6550085.1 putative dehydrogenase [Paenibacillus qinlingensis]